MYLYQGTSSNCYSVPAEWAGKAVSVRCSASEVRIVADGQVVADHPRRFGRDQLIYDPWHYLTVLDKKPGALRNGAPFVAWNLLLSIQQVRERLLKQPRGDRAFVELLQIAARLAWSRCKWPASWHWSAA